MQKVAELPLSVTITIPSTKPPYCRHRLTLSRGPSSRLRVEIESFMGGVDGPSRIEMGPLARFAGVLRDAYKMPARDLLTTLGAAGCSLQLLAEVGADLHGPQLWDAPEQPEQPTKEIV